MSLLSLASRTLAVPTPPKHRAEGGVTPGRDQHDAARVQRREREDVNGAAPSPGVASEGFRRIRQFLEAVSCLFFCVKMEKKTHGEHSFLGSADTCESAGLLNLWWGGGGVVPRRRRDSWKASSSSRWWKTE